MRRALGIVRNSMLPVVITADRSVVTLRASTEHASLACQTTAAVNGAGDGGLRSMDPNIEPSDVPITELTLDQVELRFDSDATRHRPLLFP